jgi:hypothetical protein
MFLGLPLRRPQLVLLREPRLDFELGELRADVRQRATLIARMFPDVLSQFLIHPSEKYIISHGTKATCLKYQRSPLLVLTQPLERDIARPESPR